MKRKIALIGAGNWGKSLAHVLHELGVLRAVAEPSEHLRGKLAQTYPGVKLCPDYEALIADPTLDAVAIATPAPTHHAIAAASIAEGKDVFVEKPMTLNTSEAEDLIQRAEAAERILMVGHLLLYQPAIQFIKSFLDEGKLGRIYSIHQERMKLGRARVVENVTWSLGVHDIAVLLYLVGESPRTLRAHGGSALTKGVEDDVYLHMEFGSGVKAHLHNSWLWPENRRCLTIIGEEGMLVYNERKGEVELHRKSIDQENLQNIEGGVDIIFEAEKDQPLQLELIHFLDCIEKRATPISGGPNGLEVVRALERITMS